MTIAARHPYPKKDPHAARITYYKQFEKEIDDTGIVWPITLKQIPKFESLNRYANLILAKEKNLIDLIVETLQKGNLNLF